MVKTHDFAPILGKYINYREAEISDAKFILDLRLQARASAFIGATPPELEAQINYMRNYKQKEREWYFIATNKNGKPLGTNRIYSYPIWHKNWENDERLSPGSWIMSVDSNPLESLESDFLIKRIFFMNFPANRALLTIHFENSRVLKFHQSWGAKIIGENAEHKHFCLELSRSSWQENEPKFAKKLYGAGNIPQTKII